MAETLEFNDIFQEVKGSMVRIAWAFIKGRSWEEFVSVSKSLTLDCCFGNSVSGVSSSRAAKL